MTERTTPETKDELLATIDDAWRDLWAVVADHDDRALTERHDAAGWSAADHLAHVAAWERSVLVMIRDGRPQHEGLGISAELFATEGYDEKNEAIREQTSGWSVDAVRELTASVHAELIATIGALSDADLQRPCASFVAGAPDFAILGKISGNTWSHYDEHREWIAALLAA